MLLVFAMKCCTKCLSLCLITIIAACLPHLLICTCLISSPIACPPSSSVLSMLLSIVFFFIFAICYISYLRDPILACLYTYFLFHFYFFVSIHAIATILYCHLPYGFSMQFMCLIWSLFLKFFMVLAWWNVFVYLWCCSLVSTTFYYFPFVPVCTTWLLCFLIQLLSTNMSLPWLLGHIQKYERVSLSFKQCWVWSVF